MAMGVLPCFVDAFENRYANSEDEVETDPTFSELEIAWNKIPFWRSGTATQFVDFIEKQQTFNPSRNTTPGLKGRPRRGNKARPRRRRSPPVVDYTAIAPPGLPEDWYNPEYLGRLTFEDVLKLNMRPRMFPASGNFLSIIPSTIDVTLYNQSGQASIPPHVSNIPVASCTTGITFPNSPQFEFINHPIFSVPPQQTPASGSSANPEESELMEHNSLFSGSDSDEHM